MLVVGTLNAVGDGSLYNCVNNGDRIFTYRHVFMFSVLNMREHCYITFILNRKHVKAFSETSREVGWS